MGFKRIKHKAHFSCKQKASNKQKPTLAAKMGGARNDSSSEEDGDDEWRAAIDSIVNDAHVSYQEQEVDKHKPHIKLYQLKAQKLLDDMLEKSIELVTPTDNKMLIAPVVNNDGGVRLFKSAPRGIVFDHVDELRGPRKKPRIIPGEEIDEKSKKFRKQLQSVTVDGAAIIEKAKALSEKSLSKLEAREAAAKEAAEREENRIAELRKVRGKKWLPSVAKYMRLHNISRR